MNADRKIIGAVGVIGPTRLNYGRIVPIVDYTAQLVGRADVRPGLEVKNGRSEEDRRFRRDMARCRRTPPLRMPRLAEDGLDFDAEDDLIEALEAERDELKDRLMRALAEAENARKRGDRDRREAEQYGGSKLARDMLPVYDNLKRAMDAATKSSARPRRRFSRGSS
jgi:hypothetical protein